MKYVLKMAINLVIWFESRESSLMESHFLDQFLEKNQNSNFNIVAGNCIARVSFGFGGGRSPSDVPPRWWDDSHWNPIRVQVLASREVYASQYVCATSMLMLTRCRVEIVRHTSRTRKKLCLRLSDEEPISWSFFEGLNFFGIPAVVIYTLTERGRRGEQWSGGDSGKWMAVVGKG